MLAMFYALFIFLLQLQLKKFKTRTFLLLVLILCEYNISIANKMMQDFIPVAEKSMEKSL